MKGRKMKNGTIIVLIMISILFGGLALHYQSKSIMWEERAWEQSKMTDRAIEVAKDCRDTLKDCVEIK